MNLEQYVIRSLERPSSSPECLFSQQWAFVFRNGLSFGSVSSVAGNSSATNVGRLVWAELDLANPFNGRHQCYILFLQT